MLRQKFEAVLVERDCTCIKREQEGHPDPEGYQCLLVLTSKRSWLPIAVTFNQILKRRDAKDSSGVLVSWQRLLARANTLAKAASKKVE
ncbi:MAG: hypothetical protein U5L01_07755 [Rheinheimera sp.]|nr:hypothetical protein [Rheinheimera sp.]